MILRAYGFAVEAPGLELPGAAAQDGPADVAIALAGAPEEVAAAYSGPADPPRDALRRVDGRAVRYEAGRAGDWRITWDGAGAFHVAAAGDRVLAWAPDGAGHAWTRFLLDSVLTTVALRRGGEALHAATVALPGGAVAVTAGQGGGKTTLTAALLAAGGTLVADDVSVLCRTPEGVAVAPAPPVMNLARGGPAGAPEPEALGEVLAELEGEAWVLARDVAAGPVALRAVVVLERRPGAELGLRTAPGGPMGVLARLLDTGTDPERARARFELAADLAGQAALRVLDAPPDAPPARMAEIVAGLAAR